MANLKFYNVQNLEESNETKKLNCDIRYTLKGKKILDIEKIGQTYHVFYVERRR